METAICDRCGLGYAPTVLERMDGADPSSRLVVELGVACRPDIVRLCPECTDYIRTAIRAHRVATVIRSLKGTDENEN